MGMQWLPTPKLGANGAYPNGLVAAAEQTSKGSTPCGMHASAISFAYAIIAIRWYLSYSFVISATSGLDTGTIDSKTAK
jgi:hypothetical protein